MSTASSLRDLHTSLGAAFATRHGTELVGSYGDPAGEYEAVLDGTALVDLSERSALEATGPKRLSFLQGMLSNDVEGRAPGQGCRAALLSVKGHILAVVRALVEPDRVRLETPRDRLALVQSTLEHHRVGAPVRFRSMDATVLAVLGLGATEVLRRSGVDPPLEPEAHRHASLAGHAVVVARAGDLPGGGFALHVPTAGAVDVWSDLTVAGARPAGRDALDARRVEDLKPWFGFDVSEENLLHETGLLADLHSPSKGCYLGQENVARLEARGGHVNKALRRLRLSAAAAAGDPVLRDGQEVGRVTTAASSPRFGPVALAYVHRSSFEKGTALEVGGAAATVVDGFHEE